MSFYQVTRATRHLISVPARCLKYRDDIFFFLIRQTRLVVLNPVSSQTTFTNGRNLIVSRMIEEETANTYAVKFTSITNVPDNLQSSEDLLAVKAKFLVVNQPLILSGRDFDIFCTVHFSGGTVSQTTKISIVGPLLKPLLKLAKSFQV